MEVFISAHNFSSLECLCGKQLIVVTESPSCGSVTISFPFLCASEAEVLCSPVICLLITILCFVYCQRLVQWLEIKLGVSGAFVFPQRTSGCPIVFIFCFSFVIIFYQKILLAISTKRKVLGIFSGIV